MSNPFPGMNPYLEHPDFWSEVHISSGLRAEFIKRMIPRRTTRGIKRPYFNPTMSKGGFLLPPAFDLLPPESSGTVPPLSETDAVWADALLRERGLLPSQ
jgi:Protein of unknown function (DUF4058)